MKVIDARRFSVMSASRVIPSFACEVSSSIFMVTPTTLTKIATETINSSSENPDCRLVICCSVRSSRFAITRLVRTIASGVLRNEGCECVGLLKPPRSVINSYLNLTHRRLIDDRGDRDRASHLVSRREWKDN